MALVEYGGIAARADKKTADILPAVIHLWL